MSAVRAQYLAMTPISSAEFSPVLILLIVGMWLAAKGTAVSARLICTMSAIVVFYEQDLATLVRQQFNRSANQGTQTRQSKL